MGSRLATIPDNVHKVRGHEDHEDAEPTDYFFARLQRPDGPYHLLGFIPQSLKPYFSEAEESRQDLGAVILPKGKTTLSALVAGDRLQITPPEAGSRTYIIIFERFGH